MKHFRILHRRSLPRPYHNDDTHLVLKEPTAKGTGAIRVMTPRLAAGGFDIVVPFTSCMRKRWGNTRESQIFLVEKSGSLHSIALSCVDSVQVSYSLTVSMRGSFFGEGSFMILSGRNFAKLLLRVDRLRAHTLKHHSLLGLHGFAFTRRLLNVRNTSIKTISTGHKTNVSTTVIAVATKAITTTNTNLATLPLLSSHRHSLSG